MHATSVSKEPQTLAPYLYCGMKILLVFIIYIIIRSFAAYVSAFRGDCFFSFWLHKTTAATNDKNVCFSTLKQTYKPAMIYLLQSFAVLKLKYDKSSTCYLRKVPICRWKRPKGHLEHMNVHCARPLKLLTVSKNAQESYGKRSFFTEYAECTAWFCTLPEIMNTDLNTGQEEKQPPYPPIASREPDRNEQNALGFHSVYLLTES